MTTYHFRRHQKLSCVQRTREFEGSKDDVKGSRGNVGHHKVHFDGDCASEVMLPYVWTWS
jgi:hypothetical protein